MSKLTQILPEPGRGTMHSMVVGAGRWARPLDHCARTIAPSTTFGGPPPRTGEALPTRKDEAFRYSDVAALAGVWPVEREEIRIAAGQSGALAIVTPAGGAVARSLSIKLAAGAKFDLRILNAAPPPRPPG